MKKENNGFICEGCGFVVEPAKKTSRNHCPNCFLSLHVDEKEPGDRKSTCGGRMIPREYIVSNSELKIHFLCIACGHEHRNKAAQDDEQGDLDMRMQFWRSKYEHRIRASYIDRKKRS